MRILANADIEQLHLTVTDCMAALEVAYRELAAGQATNRPRSQRYFPLESPGHPGFRYRMKSQEGASLSSGVWALRITSDMAGTEVLPTGERRRRLLPVATDGTYCGLVLLFSLESIEPVAILHDSILQKLRVAATSGLGTRALARPNARVLGLIGSGWQAGAHLEAMLAIRDFDEIRVFSPTQANRERFAAEARERYGRRIAAVDSPRAAVKGADVVMCATATWDPVFDGRDLDPGTHVTSIVATDGTQKRRELDDTTVQRADLVVVLSREAVQLDEQPQILQSVQQGALDWDRIYELGEVLLGTAPHRTAPEQITLFDNNVGMGLQFAAVGSLALERAVAAGLGREVPTEWFLQATTP